MVTTLIEAEDARSGYHRAVAALHWLLSILILGMLAIGFLGLDPLSATDPAKIAILRWHMLGGLATLATLLVFGVLRWRLGAPARISAGSRGLDRLAWVIHRGFYLIVLLAVTSGIATARLSGLPEIVFERGVGPLPATMEALPSFRAHVVLAVLLSAMVVLHLAGVVYHHTVRRDGILRRMRVRSA